MQSTFARLAPPRTSTIGALVLATLARHRFLRFLLIGGINTVVGTGLFYAALAILPTTFTALCVSTVLAVAFNFVSTGSYVFGSRNPRRLARFYGVYAIVFVYNAVGLWLLARAGMGPRLGAIVLLPGAVALSYLLNRRFVFGSGPDNVGAVALDHVILGCRGEALIASSRE